MRIGDQFIFDPKLYSVASPSYRDILRSVQHLEFVSMSGGELVVRVDSENTIVSAEYGDGTTLVRNPDGRGGHIVIVAAPDGSFWYMNAPDCWMRLD